MGGQSGSSPIQISPQNAPEAIDIVCVAVIFFFRGGLAIWGFRGKHGGPVQRALERAFGQLTWSFMALLRDLQGASGCICRASTPPMALYYVRREPQLHCNFKLQLRLDAAKRPQFFHLHLNWKSYKGTVGQALTTPYVYY